MSAKGAILAVDPGTTESAWVVLGESGVVLAHAKESNERLRERLLPIVGGPFVFTPPAGGCVYLKHVAIEMIASYGMAVGAEVFETCLWVGRFLELCSDLPTRLVYRKDVKMHLCHSMKAKDANIRQSLIDRLGPQGTKKNPGPTHGISGDCWAALGVALVARETPWEQAKEAA